MQLYFIYNNSCCHLLCSRKCVYLWHFPPRAVASLVPVKTLYFCKYLRQTTFLKIIMIILIFQFHFIHCHVQPRLARFFYALSLISAQHTIIFRINPGLLFWAGESCVMINHKSPWGWERSALWYCWRWMGGVSLINWCSPQIIALETFWSCLDPPPPFF